MVQLTIKTAAVYGVGDLHGCFDTLTNFIKIKDITDCTFVVNGDIGLGFDSITADNIHLKDLEKIAKERNMYFVLFRGNHDDPDRFINSEKYYVGLKRVFVIQDYTVVTFENEEGEKMNLLAIGGATSIDRMLRINEMRIQAVKYTQWHQPKVSLEEAEKKVAQLYWPDEVVVYNKDALDDLQKSGIKIDCVASHTAPTFCKPYDKHGLLEFLYMDKKLEEDLDTERQTMDIIFDRLMEDGHPVRKWMYGHFHFHHDDSFDGVDFHLVDMVKNGKVDACRIF